MKNTLIFSKYLLALMVAAATLTACEPQSKTSKLPEFTGEIKLDRTRIGVGQKVTASYVVPTGGVNIESGNIYWNCDGHLISGKPTMKDGVSTINFVANYDAGEREIEFVRQYLNYEKSVSETKSIKGILNIVECDVLTSFWGDSKAVVMATANEEFTDIMSEDLTAVVKNTLIKDRIEEIHQYFFTKDKLDKVIVAVVKNAREGFAVQYVNGRALILEVDGYKRVSFDIVDIATGTKTPVDITKLKDVTYTLPISTDVENGKLELRVVLQNAKNTVTMSYQMTNLGVVMNNITYVAK